MLQVHDTSTEGSTTSCAGCLLLVVKADLTHIPFVNWFDLINCTRAQRQHRS